MSGRYGRTARLNHSEHALSFCNYNILGVRGPPMSSRNAPPSDAYPRGPARGPPPRDERSRDAGMRRPLSRDDSPPAKRMKGLPPRSAPRGGPPPRRF